MIRRSNVDPNSNIIEISGNVYQQIVKDIENRDVLQNLIACADGTIYELDDHARSGCLGPYGGVHTPAENLLLIWGNRGMVVHQLSTALRMLRLERPLRLLIEPEPLVLRVDLPADLELDEGEVLSLTCEAEGFPFPRYGWFKDDGDIPIVTNKSGCLEISTAGLNDTGDYICRIHNLEKDVLFTRWCSVTVNENLVPVDRGVFNTNTLREALPYPKTPHLVRDLPQELAVCYGEPLQLSFQAHGVGTLTYLWCREREIYQATKEPSLQIPATAAWHNASFQCTVGNEHGEIKTRECKVTVKFQDCVSSDATPRILHEPGDKKESIGSEVVFTVKAVCGTTLCYQWIHDRAEIPNACGAELRFDLRSSSQGGQYMCRIYTESNQIGAIFTRSALLIVDDPPVPMEYVVTDKVALILGQSSYRSNNKSLPAVKNDIYDVYEVFNLLGFKTMSFLDCSLVEMNKAVDIVCHLMGGKGNAGLYVVLYFLGHGFRYHGDHYLMPHDAMEGTQVSACLCTEDVERKITERLDPAFLFIGLDLCQTEMTNVMAEPLPRPSNLPICKKHVIIAAASYGEESLEQELEEMLSSFGGGAGLAGGQQPVVKSNKHRVRGIFSRDLMKVLRTHPKLKATEIYQKFTDIFARPDLKVHKKEMNPEYHINLPDYNRSLGDQILCTGQEEHYEARLIKWNQLNHLPNSTTIQIIPNLWSINISYHQKGSNILEMRLQEIDLRTNRCTMRNHSVVVSLVEETVPSFAGPVEEYPSGDPNMKRYIFFNIQRLQCKLAMLLNVDVYTESHKQKLRIASHKIPVDAGLPLVWRMWMSRNVDSNVDDLTRATPCEQSDDVETSIESTC